MTNKTHYMQLVELKFGRPLEQLLKEYIEAGMSWMEIARALDVPYATINDWRRALRVREHRTITFESAQGEESAVAA